MSQEASSTVHARIRSARLKRLGQVLRVVHATFIVMLLINLPQRDLPILATLAVTTLFLSLAYIPLRRGNAELTAEIVIGVIGVCLCVIMWHGSGLRSSAMFAYPGLLMFTVIIANKRLFYVAYLAMLSYMAILVFATHQGWRLPQENHTTWYTFFEFSVVVSSITFIVRLLATDLFDLLERMDREVRLARESHSLIQHEANHDKLTGLPNRRLAEQSFQEALAISSRDQHSVALVFMDVDNFKTINDTYGHQAGDRVLRQLSESISASLRKTDTLIRQGGDEFLLILSHVTDEAEVSLVLKKLLVTVQSPIGIDGGTFRCSCSMGVVLAPENGVDFNELLIKADTAMYQAKGAGRNRFAFYNEEPVLSEA